MNTMSPVAELPDATENATHATPEALPADGASQAPAPDAAGADGQSPRALLKQLQQQFVAFRNCLPLANMQYQQYTARRRVVNYGGRYDFSAQKLDEAEPLPAWLGPLRERAGAWAGIAPERFTQALVAEYAPGTPLGWHRDVPDFEDVVGISLLDEAVMRFRPYPHVTGSKAPSLKLTVAPRSIYLLRGPSRWAWQHSVSPTKALRYSITLRTPSSQRKAGP